MAILVGLVLDRSPIRGVLNFWEAMRVVCFYFSLSRYIAGFFRFGIMSSRCALLLMTFARPSKEIDSIKMWRSSANMSPVTDFVN